VLVVNCSVAWTDPGARRIRQADPALASFTPSDSLVADLARRCLGRRPVYFAVTLFIPSPMPSVTERMRPEGLAWRVAAPGDERPEDLSALERFVRERLPRAGFDDPRQRLDEDLKSLGSNYAAAAFQLATAQLGRGDGNRALATLDTLERCYPTDRWPSGYEAMRSALAETRRRAEGMATNDASRR